MPAARGRRGPASLDPDERLDRARGALMGMAIGDALGSQLEGIRMTAPAFPQLADGMYSVLKGGGPKGLKPGQVGPHLRMATALGWNLRSSKRYVEDEVLARYKSLLTLNVELDPQVTEVLNRYGRQHPEASREIWHARSRRLTGTGALARTVVLAVFFADDDEARRSAVLSDVVLTHFDFRCQLSSLVLSAAIAAGLRSVSPPTAEELAAAAETELNSESHALGRRFPDFMPEITEAVAGVRDDLARARHDDPLLYGPELHILQHPGSVRVTFRLAFWELFHAPTAEAGILDATHRGGDTAMNGALTGALLGLKFGERALPVAWCTAVLEALSVGRHGVLWETYHPRHLLVLAEPRGD